MPLYLLTVEEGRSTEAQRKHIAEDITTIHIDVTGAPPEFVNAYFSEKASAAGGYEELLEGKVVFMTGNIRAGRTDKAKAELVDRLSQSIAGTLACTTDEVDINLVEAQAAHGMEGGKILPEPGSAEEQAWRERGHA